MIISSVLNYDRSNRGHRGPAHFAKTRISIIWLNSYSMLIFISTYIYLFIQHTSALTLL